MVNKHMSISFISHQRNANKTTIQYCYYPPEWLSFLKKKRKHQVSVGKDVENMELSQLNDLILSKGKRRQ